MAVDKVPKIEPTKLNKMVIDFSYSSSFVLNYKEGLILIAALEKAEMLTDKYDIDASHIKSVSKNDITITILNHEAYLTCKRNTLLGVEK